jgi:outer membrane murein-binding lipoprotein Lpp
MHRRVLLSLVLSVTLLQGCASISRDECQVADWRTVGMEDGAQGAPPDAISRYRKACAEHGVTPDLDVHAGSGEGLKSYCTPGNGFNVGSQGYDYAVCPKNVEKGFLDAYSSGHRLYELESAVNEALDGVTYTSNQIDYIKKDLAGKEAALVSGEMSTQERVQLALDIKDLSRQQGELEHELVDRQRAYDNRNRQLARYRSRLAYNPDP